MSTPEVKAKGKFKSKMQELVAAGHHMKLEFHAGSPYGAVGVDVTGVIDGVAVAVELKRFDGKGVLTARQKATLAEFAEAGAKTAVIDSEQALVEFADWVRGRTVHTPTELQLPRKPSSYVRTYTLMTTDELVTEAQLHGTTPLERELSLRVDAALSRADELDSHADADARELSKLEDEAIAARRTIDKLSDTVYDAYIEGFSAGYTSVAGEAAVPATVCDNLWLASEAKARI